MSAFVADRFGQRHLPRLRFGLTGRTHLRHAPYDPRMTAANAPAAEFETEFADAPGPNKPAGVPGKFVVIGVATACLLITGGFLVVKLTQGDPRAKNQATLLFTEGLGALERFSSRGAAAERMRAAGDDAEAAEQLTLAEQELEAAEQAFAQSASSKFGPAVATGWLAEVQRRRGDFGGADRHFTRAIAGPAEAVVTDPDEEEAKREAFVPDPADLGGRALARWALGDAAGAAADARRALDLYAAGAETRARNQFAEYAPDRGRLEELAAGGE